MIKQTIHSTAAIHTEKNVFQHVKCDEVEDVVTN